MTAALPTVDRRTDYVSAVAVELADLAPDERAELIEELDDHVAALLEDRPDVDLIGELGTPRAYAAELRAAAGLQATGPARPDLGTRLRALGRGVDTAVPWLLPVARFLRPAWWVLRGAAFGAVLTLLVGFGYPSGGAYVLLLLGVVASLWLAQRAPRTRRWRVGTAVADVAVLLIGLWSLAALTLSSQSIQYVESGYSPACPAGVENLYAYDAAGRPLQDVRLYDQNGDPFDVSTNECGYIGAFVPTGAPNVYPWPSAATDWAPEPTGPPASLAPLPGATVPTSSGSAPSAAPGTGTTPTTGATPTVSPTR